MADRQLVELKEIVIRFIKGFVVGASMLVPGVSGGTMAIVLNIYNQLINAVSRIRNDIKNNGLLLGNYAVGGLAGIIFLSGPLLNVVNNWTKPSLFFFMGCIIASIPPLYAKTIINRIKINDILISIVGLTIGISLIYIPKDIFYINQDMSFKMFMLLIMVGFVIAVALILPGISGSYILLVFGMYEVTLNALKEFNLIYILPISIGLLIGIFGMAKVIDNLMNNHPRFIYMLIIGFMIGSLYQIFPGIPTGNQVILSLVCFVLGLTIISLLVYGGKKSQTKFKS